MKNAYSLPENELIDLYKATMTHCAGVVLSNVGGGDDSQDYIDSALDIMTQVQAAYVDDANTDNFVALRDCFRNLIDDSDPYASFASDAIPAQWDAFMNEQEG
jgi:hypothetical protein